MIRFKLALIIGGGVLVFFGVQEMRLSSGCKSEPKKMTCAELSANGPGDNAHVVMNDFTMSDEYVYNESSKGGSWTGVWIPAMPLDGPWAQELQKALEAGDPPPKPTGIRVIVKSSSVKNLAQLQALDAQDSIQGVVVNKIEGIGSEEKRLLAQSYPGSKIDECWILEVGRAPAGSGKLAGFFVGGLVCAGLGIALFAKK